MSLPRVPQGLDRICTYCFGTGKVQLARACACQQPDRHGCDGRCEDGSVYTYDFCKCLEYES